MEQKGKCRSCGAEVIWTTTTSGKVIPLDPKTYTVVTPVGTTVTGRQSHFATCPHAKQWRKNAGK